MDRYATTLRALATPRRAIPIALTGGALVAVQLDHSGARSALVPLGMVIGFVVLGPWSWRVFGSQPRRVVGGLLAGAIAAAVVAVFGVVLPQLLELGPTFLTDRGSLLVATVLFLVGSWGLGRDLDRELELGHSQLKAIQTHLDPHFLYNTLNAIAEWCAEDPRVAEQATLRLASMLRDLLEGLERRTWPLARELALVAALLELHRIRDTEAFTVSLEVEVAAGTIEVPPLLLVTLAENAVKHGPRSQHRGPIVVRVAVHAGRVRLEIENPGACVPGDAGRGLLRLRQRLSLAYGTRARFELSTIAGTRTRAALELPQVVA